MNKRLILFLILAILVVLPVFSVEGADLSETLKGRILLQVEERGEAWYVNPDDGKRHFLGRPTDAFSVMRSFGLGISEGSYKEFNGYAPERLAGKILLRVEDKGQAYYVDPTDMKMHYLGRPADAFEVMRSLGLGITNANINKIYTWYKGERVAEISPEDGRAKAENFINKYLMKAGNSAVVGALVKQSGIYSMQIQMPNEQIVEAGLTLNGEKFFSQVYNFDLNLPPVVGNESKSGLLSNQSRQNIESYLESKFLSGSNQAEITDVELVDGVFRLSFSTSLGSNIESYMTTDGQKFFPQVIDIEDFVSKQSPATVTEKEEDSGQQKQTRPHVELFVMSHCPFGLQMEKGILPVVELLGDKIDFELKFVDYAMHGQKELNEQLAQFCIQEKYGQKLVDYLECFTAGIDSSECIATNEMELDILSDCVVKADSEYSVTDLYNDKSTWKSGRYPLFPINNADVKVYEVKGSPALVINGEQKSTGRDSASLLRAVCEAFIDEPEECATELSTQTPAPGFGGDTEGTVTSNSCTE